MTGATAIGWQDMHTDLVAKLGGVGPGRRDESAEWVFNSNQSIDNLLRETLVVWKNGDVKNTSNLLSRVVSFIPSNSFPFKPFQSSLSITLYVSVSVSVCLCLCLSV